MWISGTRKVVILQKSEHLIKQKCMSLVLPDFSVVFYYSLILTRFFLIIVLFFGNFFV